MGRADKSALMLAGRPLLAHLLDRLEPQTDHIALNAPADHPAPMGLPLVPDLDADRPGPLAGIRAAMEWAAAQGATHVATVAIDTPFLPGDLIPQLMLHAEGHEGPVIASCGGRLHPVVGLWPVHLRQDLAAALAAGIRRVTDWTEAQGAIPCDFPATRPDPFFNINTPEDLRHAEDLIGAAI